MTNETLDLYPKEATLLKFIHEEHRQPQNRLSLLFEPSDKTLRRLYGIPSNENYISDH